MKKIVMVLALMSVVLVGAFADAPIGTMTEQTEVKLTGTVDHRARQVLSTDPLSPEDFVTYVPPSYTQAIQLDSPIAQGIGGGEGLVYNVYTNSSANCEVWVSGKPFTNLNTILTSNNVIGYAVNFGTGLDLTVTSTGTVDPIRILTTANSSGSVRTASTDNMKVQMNLIDYSNATTGDYEAFLYFYLYSE